MPKIKLFLSAFLWCLPFIAVASPSQIPDVVVSATRAQQSYLSLPTPIQVIDQSDIQKSGANHLAELLARQSALQIRDLFGDGTQTTISMRGFGENAAANTLILVDGRRLNEPDLAAPDLSTLSLQNIERIELVHGSAGTLFGDQAVGGVINIITQSPQGANGTLRGRVGSFATQSGDFGIQHQYDNGFGFLLMGAHQRSDNYRDRNHTRSQKLSGKLDYQGPAHHWFAELSLAETDQALPGALSNAEVENDRRAAQFAHDFSDTTTLIGRIGAQASLNDEWLLESEMTARGYTADGRLSNTLYQQSRQLFSINPRIVGTLPLHHGELLTTLGLDTEWINYDIESQFGQSDAQQWVLGLYGQVVYPIGPTLSLTLGSRISWLRTDLSDSTAFTKKQTLKDRAWVKEIGLTFQPTQQMRIFARRDENFRFAKVDEQSFTPINEVNQPRFLDTQTGVSYELGSEWWGNNAFVSARLYRLLLDNEIIFDPTTLNRFGFLGVNNHLDESVRWGVALGGEWRLWAWLTLNSHYEFIDAEFTQGALKGKKIPFVSKHVWSNSLQLNPLDDLIVSLEARTQSQRYALSDVANELRPLGGFTLVNASLQYRYRTFDIGFRVNNLFNKETHALVVQQMGALRFFPAAERNAFITLGVKLDA